MTAENLAKTLRTLETRGQRNKTKNGGYRKTATVAMTEQIQIMRERLLVLNERLEVQLMNLSEGTVIKGMEAVATTLNDMAAEVEESARIVADHYSENARQQKEAIDSRKNPKVTPFDQPDKRVDTPPEESKTKKSGSEEASPTERSIGRSETGGSGSDAGNGSNDRSDSGGEGSSGNDASRGGKDTSEEKDRTLPRRSAREKKGKTGGAGENKNLHKN